MEKNGQGVWQKKGSQGLLGSREVKLKDGAVATVGTFKLGGETIATEAGFNHNPGKAGWQPDPARYDKELRNLL